MAVINYFNLLSLFFKGAFKFQLFKRINYITVTGGAGLLCRVLLMKFINDISHRPNSLKRVRITTVTCDKAAGLFRICINAMAVTLC